MVSDGFDIAGHLVLDHTIFHMNWISHSMLYVLNSRNEFRIIYTGETIGGTYQGGDFTNCDNLSITSSS